VSAIKWGEHRGQQCVFVNGRFVTVEALQKVAPDAGVLHQAVGLSRAEWLAALRPWAEGPGLMYGVQVPDS
jgi:hypothetical protein